MSISDLKEYRDSTDSGPPAIVAVLLFAAWIVALLGAALIAGGFADKSDALVIYGASCIGSALFMGAASVAIDKLAAIERNTRKIAEAATRRDAASA